MSGPTAALARFASEARLEDLPEAVVARARMALLNFLACAIAGAGEPVVAKAAAAFRPYAGAGAATLIAVSETSDPITASYLNCLASTILAYDETHARSVVHPVGPVAATALAAAEERHCSGRQLLAALVAGVEVASRTSLAISAAPARGPVGWSQSAVCGSIGAAAAVAHLLGANPVEMSDALALGANASAGVRAMNGTSAVSMAVANAAANGYRAALLAAAGVSGPRDALEHPYGFVALFSTQPHLAHLTADLGRDYAVNELVLKPYPGAVVAHAAIEAAGAVRTQPAFDPGAVEAVRVMLHPSALALGDRPEVGNDNEASVSIQFWVATALLRAQVGPECLRAGWIADAQRRRLQQAVVLQADDSLARHATRLTVRLRSGAELHAAVSGERPMTPADVEAKFEAAAGARYRDVITACRMFEQVEDVAAFMRLLRNAS